MCHEMTGALLAKGGPVTWPSRYPPAPVAQLAQQLLDLRILVEAGDTCLQDQIRAHAAMCEVPDAVLVFRAVGVAAEVSHAGPARVLQQLHEKERSLGVVASEPQILVEPPRFLPVQVDVEQFAG